MIDEQVDDNGESYWIFESRDVSIPFSSLFYVSNERSLSSLHGLPILSTLGEDFSKRSRLPIRNSHYLEILLDCAIRLPGPLAWSIFCLRAQVQLIVSVPSKLQLP